MKFPRYLAAAGLLAASLAAQATAVATTSIHYLSFVAPTTGQLTFTVDALSDSSIVDFSLLTTGVSPAPVLGFDSDIAMLLLPSPTAGATYQVKLELLAGSQATWYATSGPQNAFVAVSSVPEPESLALLMAGVAVAGVVARRRQAA